MRPVQYFSSDYLSWCKKMSAEEILDFLESFRQLRTPSAPSRLISLKVPENLLRAFRLRCRLQNVPYQKQIKVLMRRWLESGDRD